MLWFQTNPLPRCPGKCSRAKFGLKYYYSANATADDFSRKKKETRNSRNKFTVDSWVSTDIDREYRRMSSRSLFCAFDILCFICHKGNKAFLLLSFILRLMYLLGERANDIAFWKSELNMELGALENESNDLKVLTSLPAKQRPTTPFLRSRLLEGDLFCVLCGDFFPSVFFFVS